MKRQHIVLLLFSLFIVGLIIVHEYKYDDNPYPMTTGEYVFEIIVFGGLYTALIYFVLLQVYKVFRRLI